MNDDELPPIGADDDDSRWSVERGQEAAGDGAGKGPSDDEPEGDEVGATQLADVPSFGEAEAGSLGGDTLGDGLADSELPRSDWSTDRSDEPVVCRRGRTRPVGRPPGRLRKKERMWHETLQVEMPPRLNFLSVGIGFAMGCGFCFFLMAMGFLPGSSVVPERGDALGQPQMRGVIVPAMDDEVPVAPSQTAGGGLDRAGDMPAEVGKSAVDPPGGGDGEPFDRSETDSEDTADELPGDPAGVGE